MLFLKAVEIELRPFGALGGTEHSSIMKSFLTILVGVIRVSLATILLLVVIVTALNLVMFDGNPLMARIIPLQNPGGSHQTLARFREADQSDPVDVVFLGSSHAYRGFDPRRFEAIGLKSCNLGSSSQTPLNTLTVLERQIKHLQPRLVIYALHQSALSIDGMESFYDLLANTPLDYSMVKMAWRTQQPQAWPALISTAVRNIRFPFEEAKQLPSVLRSETYLKGGYIECKQEFPAERFDRLNKYRYGQWSYGLSNVQLGYFQECIQMIKDSGANLVVCSYPIPKETRGIIADYEVNQKKIASLLAGIGVHFVDFNETMTLDTRTHYFDELHLNQVGVEKFNESLITWLKNKNLIFIQPNKI